MSSQTFCKGLIYSLMAEGEHYFTAKQIEQMSDAMSDMVDGFTTDDLKTVKDCFESGLQGGDMDDPAACMLYGYLVCAGQFIQPEGWQGYIEYEPDDYNELADRMFRIAGVLHD